MITQEDIKQFESIFSGAQKRYGLLDYYNKGISLKKIEQNRISKIFKSFKL